MVFNSEHVMKCLIDPQGWATPQQHGVDLNVIGIMKVNGGQILKEKTALQTATPVGVSRDEQTHITYWDLEPGYMYAITFSQGIEVPANAKANIIHRSSVLRAGAMLFSAEYDAGFKTNNMGAFMITTAPLRIEQQSRLAQVVMCETEETSSLYDGQWQGGKN